MMKVIFVCTGNTCRSPMAEAILKKKAKEAGMEIEVSSAGLFANPGAEMSANAKDVLRRTFKLTDFTHKARPLTKEDFDEADLVIGMTENHSRAVESLYGKNEKILSMPLPVGDPYGGDLTIYQRSAEMIEKGIDILIERGVIR